MPNYTIRQIILSHQQMRGVIGYVCMCGQRFSGEHQLEMLERDGHDTQA